MRSRFGVEFLPEAVEFLEGLDDKTREKIYFNIRKAQVVNDPELFKKLTETIWEFRTRYNKKHLRLFAFWEEWEPLGAMIIATHGLVKKTAKTPLADLQRAELIRKEYHSQNNP